MINPVRISVALALVLAGTLAGVSCGGGTSQTPGGGGNRNASVTVTIGEEPDTLDPQRSNAAVAGQILQNAGDTLVAQASNGQIVPDLASSWQPANGGLQWTFNLKHGVTFQNGDKVDAQAVKASFGRALDPATHAGGVAALLAPVKDVRVTAPDQIIFDLKQPYSPFLQNMTNPTTVIVDAAAATRMGTAFGRAPVLTGAFKIVNWVSGTSVTLVRNDAHHWGPSFAAGAPSIKTLVFRIITDDQTAVAALENNEVQAAAIPPAHVAQFQHNSAFNMYHFLRKGVGFYLEFDVNNPPFNDIRVRRALMYAIDKKAIVKVALQGQGIPACGPLPPSIPGYWPGICHYGPQYDQAKAKQLLADAGWKPGPDGKLQKNGQPFAFTVYTMATPASWADSAQLVQQQLAQIGITLQIQNFEFATLLSKITASQDQAHFMGYTYTSPDILYLLFYSAAAGGGGINFSHVQDPKLDSMINQYRQELTTAQQNQTYEEIQKYVVDQAIEVPIWNNENYGVTAKNLHNVHLNYNGLVIWQNVTVS
jgi:peptide/nickel transport system substrate-binding protein